MITLGRWSNAGKPAAGDPILHQHPGGERPAVVMLQEGDRLEEIVVAFRPPALPLAAPVTWAPALTVAGPDGVSVGGDTTSLGTCPARPLGEGVR
jgi:hypothetical protein